MAPGLRCCVGFGVVLLCASYAGVAQNPVFDAHAKARPATVSVLARTSFVHQGFAGNQDTYLADVGFKEGEHTLAKLVDNYASSANPIQRSVLTERKLLRMRLVRNAECDAMSKHLLLATREADIFDASVRTTLAGQADETVPCYRVVHDATHLAKK